MMLLVEEGRIKEIDGVKVERSEAGHDKSGGAQPVKET